MMVVLVVAAVVAGAGTAGAMAFAGHPPLVWMLSYVLAGTCGTLAAALQAAQKRMDAGA